LFISIYWLLFISRGEFHVFLFYTDLARAGERNVPGSVGTGRFGNANADLASPLAALNLNSGTLFNHKSPLKNNHAEKHLIKFSLYYYAISYNNRQPSQCLFRYLTRLK
jgi:hypothetical protein